jgi:hypothetical protein
VNEPRVVTALAVAGWNMSIAQLWGSGPKLTIVCGACRSEFQQRVAPAHMPRVRCSLCDAINELPITTAAGV